MPIAEFTAEVLSRNPHKEGTQIWKAGMIVCGMEGCDIEEIVRALTAFERTREVGVVNPERWISQFAGLESKESGKSIEPWIRIMHKGVVMTSREQFRKALSANGRADA